MKSYKDIEKQFTPEEIAESFVFPSELNKKGKEASLENFRQFRQGAESKRSSKDKIISQLLQLRFLMVDSLKEKSYNKAYNFAYFLKEYIARIQKTNKEFAQEVGIDPTELSQIINKHRQPNEKLIIRLEIHSNRNFPAIMWFKVIEAEKAFELVHDKQLRDVEHRHVTGKLEFSF
jgi:plasmid maintenance system antidote protein VapI